MNIVGVVGRSGSGKSTVAAHLAEGGAAWIDADRIGHDALDGDAVRRRLRDQFGDTIFRGERVDRRALGRLVFGDPDALALLNTIVHPVIIRHCQERIDACRLEGRKLVVIDAALLLEVPLPFDLDLVIALRCDRAELERRLRAKGVAAGDIEARLRNQEHVERSYGKADVIIDADRPLPEVLAEVDKVIELRLA